MKKWGILFIVAAFFTACDKSDSDNTDKGNGNNIAGQSQLISSIHIYYPQGAGDEESFIELSYDNQNRLVSLKDSQNDGLGASQAEIFTLTYTESTVTMTSNLNPENPLIMQLNEKGYVVHTETRLGDDTSDFTYNEQGQLVRVEDPYYTEEYIW